MIKKVIILGAGASCDYGYPVGSVLLNKIKQILSGLYNCKDSPSVLLFSKFAQHFLRFTPRSIDEYLSITKDNEIKDAGKKLIIAAIKSYESKTAFGAEDSWYNYLIPLFFPVYYRAENESDSEFEQNCFDLFSKNLEDVYIVTFNYDVSLEYFLFSHVDNGYFLTDLLKEKAKQLLVNRIKHVYGQVWKNTDISNKYATEGKLNGGNSQAWSQYYDAIMANDPSCIKVIQEERAKKNFDGLQLKIKEAQEIYVLGFGFDRINCEDVLGLRVDGFRSSIDGQTPLIFCTNFMSDCLNEKIEMKIRKYLYQNFFEVKYKPMISTLDVSSTMKRAFDFDNSGNQPVIAWKIQSGWVKDGFN